MVLSSFVPSLHVPLTTFRVTVTLISSPVSSVSSSMICHWATAVVSPLTTITSPGFRVCPASVVSSVASSVASSSSASSAAVLISQPSNCVPSGAVKSHSGSVNAPLSSACAAAISPSPPLASKVMVIGCAGSCHWAVTVALAVTVIVSPGA